MGGGGWVGVGVGGSGSSGTGYRVHGTGKSVGIFKLTSKKKTLRGHCH